MAKFYRKSPEDKTVYKDAGFTQAIKDEKELRSLGGVPDWGADASKTNIQTSGLKGTLAHTLPSENDNKFLPSGKIDQMTLLRMSLKTASETAIKRGMRSGMETVTGGLEEHAGFAPEKVAGGMMGRIIDFVEGQVAPPIEKEFETTKSIIDSIEKQQENEIIRARENLNALIAGGAIGFMSDTDLANISETSGVPIESLVALKKSAKANKAMDDRLSVSEQLEMKEAGYTIDDKGKLVTDISGAGVEDIMNAIKQVESGGNYQAKGGSGEFGAYQFMPGTWTGWSRQYASEVLKMSVDQLEMTPENQDAVARWKIQGLVSQGYSPQEIASIWNSGGPKWEGKVGVNKHGIRYDVPGYVNKVTNALQTGMGEAELLSPSQITAGNKLAKDIYGSSAIKTENGYNKFVIPILRRMQDGESIDDISDSLRLEGQSLEFTGVIRDAAQQITSKLSTTQTEAVFDKLDDVVSKGDIGDTLNFLKKMAIENSAGGTEQAKMIMGQERTVEFLDEIYGDLQAYENTGGDTNIFTGTLEEMAKKVGDVKDEELRKIATKIMKARQQYRRSMTGVAFSPGENLEYDAIFPSISKTMNFNTATIDGLREAFRGDVDFFYRFAMGDAYDEIYGAGMTDDSAYQEYLNIINQ